MADSAGVLRILYDALVKKYEAKLIYIKKGGFKILIEQEIDVKLNHNKLYYSSLGYTVFDKTIRVNAKNLPRYSAKMVKLQCDYCGKIFEDYYYNYSNKLIHHKGQHKDLCSECYLKLKTDGNNAFINGGISDSVKGRMRPWRQETVDFYNHKCVITGSSTNTVHHLYDFNYLLKLSIKRLGISVETINEGRSDILIKVSEECLKVHYEYGLGITIIPKIHKLFHSIYPASHVTPEKFYLFKDTFEKFNFDIQQLYSRDGVMEIKNKLIEKLNN